MKFWLGTDRPNWLSLEVDLFISRRRLTGRKTFPLALGEWALDSGGFTELNLYGKWETSEDEYVSDVELFQREVGNLAWVAPMDWMCEPFMLEKTGLTVYHHQELTVANFRRLRERLGELVVPVLQGWTVDEYLACWDEYAEQGIDLEAEPLVGLGSVCRRQNTVEAGLIVRRLESEGLALHAFGIKSTGIESFGDVLASADSMAWSYAARRRQEKLAGCTHRDCRHCIRYARRWRSSISGIFNQTRLEFA